LPTNPNYQVPATDDPNLYNPDGTLKDEPTNPGVDPDATIGNENPIDNTGVDPDATI
jgi:hypothetical protein